jgi:hypothetical protein
MKQRFEFEWDANKIANAFGVTADDIKEYLTDGRRVSFIIERRLKWQHPGWTLAISEGAGYDLRDPKGGLWEVRSITGQGVYFNPSNQVGKGRVFHEGGFQAKLSAIKGFILSDIVDFPTVKFFVVPVEDVKKWHLNKLIGANAKVSRKKFLEVLVPKISNISKKLAAIRSIDK